MQASTSGRKLKYVAIGVLISLFALILGAACGVFFCTKMSQCVDWYFVIWGQFGALFGAIGGVVFTIQLYKYRAEQKKILEKRRRT